MWRSESVGENWKQTVNDKTLIGKYVCYATQGGSFTWGRIKDVGEYNTMNGMVGIFILTDQITCRVAGNELEMASIQGLGNLISEGKAGPSLLPGPTDPTTLPDYQKFGERKQITTGAEKASEFPLVPTNTPEGQGLVPALEKDMGLEKSKGLRIMQKVGTVVSSVDGHPIHFILRRFGYDTGVCKSSLNLKTDIVDASIAEFQGMTDGELFIKAMQAKMAGVSICEILGQKKELALGSGEKQ